MPTKKVAPTMAAQIAYTTRNLQVYESDVNVKTLNKSKWNFQIAKCIATAQGQPSQFNVIWTSQSVTPNTLIQWKDTYGMNWCVDLPNPGASVIVGGDWQPCSIGEGYDIDPNGFWIKSTSTSLDSHFMNVGNVGYQYPGTVGLHIVVGIQNDDGSFNTIFVDPTPLARNDSAKYQPQEQIQFWYQTDLRTGTMIDGASTAIATLDFSHAAPTTGNFYYSTTYNCLSGDWIISQDKPPLALYAPITDSTGTYDSALHLYALWPSVWNSLLSIALSASKQVALKAKLGALLRVRYQEVTVEILDSLDVGITLGSPKLTRPNSDRLIGAVVEDVQGEISDCFQFISDEGDILPEGETWDVENVPST
jgi:hypothetical protein